MVAFGAVATIPFIVKGQAAGKGVVTFPQLILTYFFTSVIGGGALGLLRPISRTIVGAMVVGVLIGGIAGAAFHVATMGFGQWDGFDIFMSVILALLGSAMGLVILRRSRQLRNDRPR